MAHSHSHSNSHSNSNPCTDMLTDLQYLEHMIPHHQVAIDMSYLLIPKTTDPFILHLCRDIIRKQEYEIWEMTMMMNALSETIVGNEKPFINNTTTILDIHQPVLSKSKDGSCNPLFFKPDDHSQHMMHMEVTPEAYLEHMIPHHQVAIDMSKRLLLHSNHTYLIDFCRKLIIDQQNEIFLMNNLLNGYYKHKSDLVI